MEDDVNDFLAHFGVKGMRWGHRKAEDSTGSGRSSSADKTARDKEKAAKNYEQAAKFRTRAAASAKTVKELDELGIQSPKMRALYGKGVDQSDKLFYWSHGGISKQSVVANARKQAVKDQARNEKDAKSVEAGGLSRNQKIAIAGSVAAVGLLAAYGAYKYPDIVTRNALPGQKISVNNFMSRYMKRGAEFANVNNGLSKVQFDKLDTKDVTIPAGTVFKRLTSDPNEPLTKRLYTTFKESDNDKYAGLYGAVLRTRTETKDLHISEIKMNTDIISPSHKKRVQILMDMMNEDTGKKVDLGDGDFRSLREYLAALAVDTSSISAMMSDPGTDDLSKEDLVLKTYNNFSRQLVVNNPVTNAYFDRVKKAGYNALVDDNDRGQLSDVPMILLDAAKTTESRTSTPLTKDLEKAARKRLTELLDPIKTD